MVPHYRRFCLTKSLEHLALYLLSSGWQTNQSSDNNDAVTLGGEYSSGWDLDLHWLLSEQIADGYLAMLSTYIWFVAWITLLYSCSWSNSRWDIVIVCGKNWCLPCWYLIGATTAKSTFLDNTLATHSVRKDDQVQSDNSRERSYANVRVPDHQSSIVCQTVCVCWWCCRFCRCCRCCWYSC